MAVQLLGEHPQEATAGVLAADVGLSPSWFRHLFAAQTGTSMRRMFGPTATTLLGSGPRLVVPPTGP